MPDYVMDDETTLGELSSRSNGGNQRETGPEAAQPLRRKFDPPKPAIATLHPNDITK